MASLLNLNKTLFDLRDKREKLQTTYEKEDIELHKQIKEIEKSISEERVGLDSEKIALAESKFVFYGMPEVYNNARQLIQDAIREITFNASPLSKEYLGLKNYDRFAGKRSDHPYGYKPSHGDIVLSVARTPPRDEKLSVEEREAAIYFLSNWQAILDARKRGVLY